jgi:formyltetrahydrofolate-dependent phosphoribosylglycinamide formyltransferase
LIISYPLGQFRFFRNYLIKIWNRINGKKNQFKNTGRIKLAIFSSGAGSNAKKIIEYFSSTPVKVDLVLTNNPSAGVIRMAAEYNIDCCVIDKEKFFNGNAYLPELKERGINFLVLAGFLWKIPPALVNAYPKKIINIHPALLPKYGGKGMYGHFVHEAVIADKEKQSGITIHFADERYDHGEIIFQATCEVGDGETAESLSKKIQVLEHLHYPTVIDGILKKQNPR